jgi:hypothetical protein
MHPLRRPLNPIAHATHWWTAERQARGLDSAVGRLIPFLFENAGVLYTVTRSLPEHWDARPMPYLALRGTGNYFISIPPEAILPIRASISLVGDLFALLKRLSTLTLLELGASVALTLEATESSRDLRNFYAHLDERLTECREARRLRAPVNRLRYRLHRRGSRHVSSRAVWRYVVLL